MYSEDDLPIQASYGDISDRLSNSSEDDRLVVLDYPNDQAVSGLQNADIMVERVQEVFGDICAEYDWVFEREGGAFRTAFPAEYFEPDEGYEDQLHDLVGLLDTHVPCTPEIAAANALPGSGPEWHHAPADSTDKPAVPAPDTGDIVSMLVELSYKPSPGSRWMTDHFSDCLLIPVALEVNRKQLCELHADLPCAADDAPVDFVVGYHDRDASGWALPLTTHANTLAKLKTLYPGWRSPVAGDHVQFMRSSRVSSTPGGRTKQAAAGGVIHHHEESQMLRVTRLLSARMISVGALLRCVAEAGGWARVKWVAFDTELALSTNGAVPVPVEFAFVPLGTKESNIHFFTHPGYLYDSYRAQAMRTSVGMHGIPIDRAHLLRHDYAALAERVEHELLFDKRVILVNKGAPGSPALAEPQSIRWLFAAAAKTAAAEPTDGRSWVPPQCHELRCFDVSVLRDAVADAFPPQVEAASTGAAAGKRAPKRHPCSYHKQLATHPMFRHAHCALNDATKLRRDMRAFLPIFPPPQPPPSGMHHTGPKPSVASKSISHKTK